MVTLTETDLPGVFMVEPRVFTDERGFFFESWNARDLSAELGHAVAFVQDNHSRSRRGVLRGLHYQLPPSAQAKLVRCVRGAVWDVAVDIRRRSPTFGDWTAHELSEDSHRQMYLPAGFAHGFLALTDVADVLYKTTTHYDGAADRAISWDDPDLAIDWPLDVAPIMSAKDADAPRLADAELFEFEGTPDDGHAL